MNPFYNGAYGLSGPAGVSPWPSQQVSGYMVPGVNGYNVQLPAGAIPMGPQVSGPEVFVDDDGNEFVVVGGKRAIIRRGLRQDNRQDRRETREADKDIDELQQAIKDGASPQTVALLAATIPPSKLDARPALKAIAQSFAAQGSPEMLVNATRAMTLPAPGQNAVGTPVIQGQPPVPANTFYRPLVFAPQTVAGNTAVIFQATAAFPMWLEDLYMGFCQITGNTSPDSVYLTSLQISGAEYLTNVGGLGGIPGSRLNNAVERYKLGGLFLPISGRLQVTLSGITGVIGDTAKVAPEITVYGQQPSA